MIDLGKIQKQIVFVLHRFHIVLFVTIALGGLSILIFFLNSALSSASDTSSITPTVQQSSFDKATIDSLNRFYRLSDGEANIEMPSGRINPFSE